MHTNELLKYRNNIIDAFEDGIFLSNVKKKKNRFKFLRFYSVN